MASSVDNRVVSMEFDNKSFEQNASTSLSTLDKLKKSLDFSGSKKGLDDLSQASKSFNLNGIANAVEGIAQNFDAMGAVAFAVINNIVSRAIDAGIRIAKAFSMAPAIQGFQEYELKIGAIQTIMAGTGESLDTVNQALQELNAYSDKTIYSFADMTSNIGKFTNAGVSLKDSIAAIQGIANAAALSGANAGEAARAMYNFGQALSTGSVRLIDWKSIELANMATKEFKDQLIEGAIAAGTLKRGLDGTVTTMKGTAVDFKTFNATLEEAWLTSDVLTKTLGKYADATTDIGRRATEAATVVKTFTQLMSTVKESIGSGWSASFELLIGNFDEAKALWTDVNTAISGFVGKQADARNEILSGWKALGGRNDLISGLKMGLGGLAKIMNTIKDAFRDVFPRMTAVRLLELTRQFDALMKKLVLSNETLDKIKRVFTGVFSVVKIGVEILKGFGRVLGGFISSLAGAGSGKNNLLDFFAGIGDGLTNLKTILVDDGVISRFFDKFAGYAADLGSAFGAAIGWLTTFKDAVVNVFTGGSAGVSDAVSQFNNRFTPLIETFKKVGDAIGNMLERLGLTRETLSKVWEGIKNFFSAIPQAIADVFAKTNYNQALDTVNTGLFAGLVLMVKKFMNNGFADLGGGVLKNISRSFEELTGVLKSMQMKVKAEALMKIAIALGILTASLLVLSLIDSAALTKSMVAIGVGMLILLNAMTIMNEIIDNPKDAAKLGILAGSLMAISGAMLLFAFAAKTLATMSWEELAKGLGGIAVMLALVVKSLEFITTDTKGLIKAGVSIMIIAVALNLLAAAVKLFSMMSYSELGRGLIGIAVGLGIMVATIKLINKAGGNSISSGIGLMAMAASLTILASAVKLFSMLSWEEMGKGMAGIAVSLLVLAGAIKLINKAGGNALSTGLGLMAIGLGLIAMSAAIKVLGSMSWDELLRGVSGIAVVLTALAIAANAMEEAIGGAIAIAIMSGSLYILAKGLQEFSEVAWQDLLKGLGGLAATLAILGIAALSMSEIIPALLGLGAALLLIGGAFALFGVGANLVATAFAIMATSGTQGLEVLTGAFTMLIQAIPPLLVALGEGIIKLGMKLIQAAPEFVKKMGEVLSALLQVIINNMPKFGQLLVELIHTGLNAIRETFPDIVETGMMLLLELLRGIRDNITEVTNTVIDIILQFLSALTERMGEVVTAGLGVLVAFLQGIADNIGLVLEAATNVITEFISGIGAMATEIVKAGTQALVDFLGGIAAAIPQIATAVTEIFTTFLAEIAKQVPLVVDAFFQMFIDLFNGLADVIRKRSGELGKAMGNLVSALVSGIGNALKEAIKQIANDLFPGLGSVVNGILDFFGIASPSKMFYWIGEQLMLGFKFGIDDNFHKPTQSLMDGSERMVGTMSTTMSKIAEIMNRDINIDPTITPVLDLTEVNKGVGRLNGIFAKNSAIDATLSYGQAALISSTTSSPSEQNVDITPTEIREIKFEQHNHSPEALSTSDIYRLTSNQIALAKEELQVR